MHHADGHRGPQTLQGKISWIVMTYTHRGRLLDRPTTLVQCAGTVIELGGRFELKVAISWLRYSFLVVSMLRSVSGKPMDEENCTYFRTLQCWSGVFLPVPDEKLVHVYWKDILELPVSFWIGLAVYYSLRLVSSYSQLLLLTLPLMILTPSRVPLATCIDRHTVYENWGSL